jgi:hypothetical protein
MDTTYWNKQLEIALSIKNYELMKEAVKNGAKPINHILYYITHDDCIDLLQYFLFSPELRNHCIAGNDNTYYEHDNLFITSCSNGAINIIKFILRDPRLCNKFKEKSYYKGFLNACSNANIKIVDFLLNCPQTKNVCQFEYNNFKIVKEADIMTKRYPTKNNLWEYIIMNLEFSLVKQIVTHVIHNKKICYPLFQARELREELTINNRKNIKPIKI